MIHQIIGAWLCVCDVIIIKFITQEKPNEYIVLFFGNTDGEEWKRNKYINSFNYKPVKDVMLYYEDCIEQYRK